MGAVRTAVRTAIRGVSIYCAGNNDIWGTNNGDVCDTYNDDVRSTSCNNIRSTDNSDVCGTSRDDLCSTNNISLHTTSVCINGNDDAGNDINCFHGSGCPTKCAVCRSAKRAVDGRIPFLSWDGPPALLSGNNDRYGRANSNERGCDAKYRCSGGFCGRWNEQRS